MRRPRHAVSLPRGYRRRYALARLHRIRVRFLLLQAVAAGVAMVLVPLWGPLAVAVASSAYQATVKRWRTAWKLNSWYTQTGGRW